MATNGANGNSLPALHSTAEEFLKHDYDFIICGGGTAGLVVAARLTENEDISVRTPTSKKWLGLLKAYIKPRSL